MNQPPAAPLLLDENEAERYSGISKYTLRGYRRQRRGPIVVKLGRSVRYRPEDLSAFIAENVIPPGDMPKVRRRPCR
ncbi:MAG TPA: helix-turn-helix domain-containing protein [Thermoanaerobaculia bacterium]|nr:helix-turn-helix domain-containing protein [Thermoanaerobaculia bacterium]